MLPGVLLSKKNEAILCITIKEVRYIHKCTREKCKDLLRDLHGKPYKFYRGKDYNDIDSGRFFCSCFDIAQSYCFGSDNSVFEAEILVENPLVIDATTEDGYSGYEYLAITDCALYPEEIRPELISCMQRNGNRKWLSTDEVLQWAKTSNIVDAVIIKNVREGINSHLPIYDVIDWRNENLASVKEISNEQNLAETYRINTYKRVDLSKYIVEKETDGVLRVCKGDGYYLIDTIQRDGQKWYVETNMVIETTIPVDVYCFDTRGYISSNRIKDGVYEYAGKTLTKQPLTPCDGIIQVKRMMPNCRYKVSAQ